MVAASVVLLTACGGGSSNVVRPPASAASSPTTRASAATTSSPVVAPSSSGPRVQRVTVTPASGLTSGQQVHVSGSGYSPDEPLVVTECAVKGAKTGAGDCNIGGMVSADSDASGNVEIGFIAVKGPFGANQIVCGSQQSCLISVTQATLSPTEEADTPIQFR